MIVWIMLAAIAIICLAGVIWIGKLPRNTWEAVAACVTLAAAGYLYQGSPGYAGAPAQSITGNRETAVAMLKMRQKMDANLSQAKPYLITSDSFSKDGNYKYAAAYLQGGLKKHPKNPDLWAALGLQLMLASDGRISPPAKFAFDRAKLLSPNHPAPAYFEGLSAIFENKPEITLRVWQELLNRTPGQAKWRADLESQVSSLTQSALEQMKQSDAVKKDN
jgi:cytochrome c-type biogenesis protein CcmH